MWYDIINRKEDKIRRRLVKRNKGVNEGEVLTEQWVFFFKQKAAYDIA